MGAGIRHAVLAACILGATGPASGQDALRGKRIYHDGGRLNGAGISCVDCHGGFPGALHGIAKGAGNPGAIEYALGAIPQMAQLRGRVSQQDVADLAAYLANPQVPSPQLRVVTSGPAANRHSPERLEFSAKPAHVSPPSTVRLTNSGDLPLRLLTAPALAGPHAGEFEIASNGCTPMILWPQDSCSIVVEFRPAGPAGPAGPRHASLGVEHDWVGGGFGVALIGDVNKPALARELRK